MPKQRDKRQRKRLRRIRKILLVSLAVLVVLAAIAPSLVPSSFLSASIRSSLEASLGRPVRVGHCSLGWFSGLTVDELWVDSGEDRPGESLVYVQGLTFGYQPWELPRAVFSSPPFLGRTIIEKLVLWAVRTEDGRLDVVDSSAPPPEFKSIDILSGDLHLVDRQAGTHRQVTQLRVTLGRLEGTDRVYVTGGGRLLFADDQGKSTTGVVSLNGLLDHFDLNNVAGITGGCDIWWSGVGLSYFVPGLRAAGGNPWSVSVLTDGQTNLRIDASDTITFEGSVSAPRLVVEQAGGPKDVQIDQPTLSFIGHYNKTSGKGGLKPLQVSGAGSRVTVEGDLNYDPRSGLSGKLELGGHVNWTPLKHGVLVLGRAMEDFTSATGTADIEALNIVFADNVATFKGAVDLARTELVWRPYFEKPADRRAELRLDGRCDLTTGALDLAEVSLVVDEPGPDSQGETGPAQVKITARTAKPGDDEAAGHPGRRRLAVRVEVPDVTLLRRHVPAAERVLADFGAEGSLAIDATVDPWSAGQPVTLRVDAEGMSFQTAPEVGKEAGKPLAVVLEGKLRGENGDPEMSRAELVLGPSVLEWTGKLTAEAVEGAKMPRLDFDGHLEAQGIEHWMRLGRPYLLPRPFIGLVGTVACNVGGCLDARELHLEATDIDATMASVELSSAAGRVETSERLLTKRLGKETKGSATVVYDRQADRLRIESAMSSGANTAELTCEVSKPAEALGGDPALPGEASLDLAVHCRDVPTMLADLPALESLLGPYGPRGEFEGHLLCRVGEHVRISGNADLTRTSYTVTSSPSLLTGAEPPDTVTKVSGMPQTLEFDVVGPRRIGSGPVEFEVARLKATTGQCVLAVDKGMVSVDGDSLRSADLARTLPSAVHSLGLEGSLTVVQTDRLREFSSWWRKLSGRYALEGWASVEVDLAATRNSGRFGLVIDATSAGFEYGEGTHKPVGTRADVDVLITTLPTAGQFSVEKAELRIADTQADCRGTLYCQGRLPLVADTRVDFALHVEGRSGQLARLAQLIPVRSLRSLELQGGVEFALDVASDRYGMEIEDGDFTFRKARVRRRGADIDLDGRLRLGRKRLFADALAVGIADTQVVVAADIESPLDAPRGQFAITGPRLDLDQLLNILGLDSSEPAPPQVGIPPTWPATSAWLARMDLRGRLAFDHFTFSDENGIVYDWRAFASDLGMVEGRLDVPAIKAIMLSGVVVGRVSGNMNDANPVLKTEYAARHLEAGEQLAPLVSQLFPNMTVNGTATQIHQVEKRLFATADRPNYPFGVSQFEATDGIIEGPGAPDWMVNLLPGLKLTTYHFKRMESLSTLRPDGRVENRMRFDGSPYAIYINGHTDPDGTADYTLGVDMLNSLAWGEGFGELEQGWIPLLVYKGRIADSKWVERRVDYVSPDKVASAVFLQRILLVKLLQRRGDTRRPDFKPYDFDIETPADGAGGR